jgi:uncharacterized membrane protein YagU involved in acid resistance
MAASTMEKQHTIAGIETESLVHGVVAGLVGGSVFGVQMAVGGMLPMVAQMIGSESVVVGFILHLIISAIIGATYGLIAPRLPGGWLTAMGLGIVFGVIWWVLGALIIMPLVLGMSAMVLVIEDMQLMSLVGHVIFGIITATVYALIAQRS